MLPGRRLPLRAAAAYVAAVLCKLGVTDSSKPKPINFEALLSTGAPSSWPLKTRASCDLRANLAYWTYLRSLQSCSSGR